MCYIFGISTNCTYIVYDQKMVRTILTFSDTRYSHNAQQIKPDYNVGVLGDDIDNINETNPYRKCVRIDQMIVKWTKGVRNGPVVWISFMTGSNDNIGFYNPWVFRQYLGQYNPIMNKPISYREVVITTRRGKNGLGHFYPRWLTMKRGIFWAVTLACITVHAHLPWCMSESLTRGGRENVPCILGACATRIFTYLARVPWAGKVKYLWCTFVIGRSKWRTESKAKLSDRVISDIPDPNEWQLGCA